MKKLTIYIVMATLCLNFNAIAQIATLNLKGKIIDENGMAVPGINLSIKDTKIHTITDKDGFFGLKYVDPGSTLKISGIGYKTKLLTGIQNWDLHLIIIQSDNTSLKEVEIVSTGYQNLPKERATGSFVLIDSSIINRKVSTNILDRLDGVTSGLTFNVNKLDPNSSGISIRGKSTLFANDQPLVILDNFPYNGDLNNINPNDVASITVLKDAAAASIWGVKAGNGVIVITSKKGKINSLTQVNFSGNITIGAKPNLFYTPQLTSAEYIDIEKYLFDKGFYYKLNDGYSAISPVLDILQQKLSGTLSHSSADAQIDVLKNNDVRFDINKYINRKPINQQYQVSVNGGGNANQFYISAGWDKNLQSLIANNYSRVTLTANNSCSFFNNKIELSTGIQLTQNTTNQNSSTFIPQTPYEMLKDFQGNNLSVIKDLRKSYIDTAGNKKLLDWRYIPLNDNIPYQSINQTDYRISNSVTLKIIKQLKLTGYYLFQKGINNFDQNYNVNSYYTRNLINTYSQINSSNGQVTQIIPQGDIFSKDKSAFSLNIGRIQLNYEGSFGENHRINAIGGFEVSDYTSFSDSFTLYGYNPSTGTNGNQAINFGTEFPQYYGFNMGTIPVGLASQGNIDRNRSYYINASYSYKQRYNFSASARRDESNIFGVSTNNKGVPLWSAGLGWKIDQEPFYNLELLPRLSLRVTYGYNGNTDKTATAYLTVISSGRKVNSFRQPYYSITNPPNPSLRWEKVGITNFGVDFGLKNDWLTGSFEYYTKNSTDLIANSPVAQQTGVLKFRGNSADMKNSGIDLVLNFKLSRSTIEWNTSFLFSYETNKVTKYDATPGSNENIISGIYLNPLVGYPLYSIFSFPSSTLDDKGNPRGYLNGQISSDYQSILNSTNPSELKYHGSAAPRYFGSIINNFRYKQVDVSIGIGFKLGYYFRRNSVNYSALFAGQYQQADFNKRWQNPGDEDLTTIPSIIYPIDQSRDSFYTYSSSLVEKADNIRLQDIKIGYTLDKRSVPTLPFSMLQFYFYANNLAILWRANNHNLDPDSPFISPVTKSVSFGVKATF